MKKRYGLYISHTQMIESKRENVNCKKIIKMQKRFPYLAWSASKISSGPSQRLLFDIRFDFGKIAHRFHFQLFARFIVTDDHGVFM